MVGAGESGRRVAGDVMVTAGAELAALCDRSLPALTRLSPRFPNIALISDFSQILEDPTIEAIVIATPLPPAIDSPLRAWPPENMCLSSTRSQRPLERRLTWPSSVSVSAWW